MNLFTLATLVVAAAASPSDPGPEAQLIAAVRSSLPLDLDVVDVKVLGKKSWSAEAELRVAWERVPRPGTSVVTVLVREGEAVAKTWASVKLAALRPVLVTTRALELGAELAAEDVKVELRPVAFGEGLDLAPGALVGQATLRALEAGEVVGKKDVLLPTPVARGTPVKVVSSVGGARILVAGTLLTSARVGARAKVRVAFSPRPLRGRLEDRETVVLEVIR